MQSVAVSRSQPLKKKKHHWVTLAVTNKRLKFSVLNLQSGPTVLPAWSTGTAFSTSRSANQFRAQQLSGVQYRTIAPSLAVPQETETHAGRDPYRCSMITCGSTGTSAIGLPSLTPPSSSSTMITCVNEWIRQASEKCSSKSQASAARKTPLHWLFTFYKFMPSAHYKLKLEKGFFVRCFPGIVDALEPE